MARSSSWKGACTGNRRSTVQLHMQKEEYCVPKQGVKDSSACSLMGNQSCYCGSLTTFADVCLKEKNQGHVQVRGVRRSGLALCE